MILEALSRVSRTAAAIRRLDGANLVSIAVPSTGLHTAGHPLQFVHKLTRLRCVDNSAIGKTAMLEGKPPKTIHVYTKTSVGRLGDKVLVTVKGEKKKGFIVGSADTMQDAMIPRFDTYNVVLVDDGGTPLGNRVLVPIPNALRKKPDLHKVIAIATKFI